MSTNHYNVGISGLRETHIETRQYNDRPAISIDNTVNIYAGEFGHSSSRDLRLESRALNKLADALSEAANWCLEQSDIKLGEELAAERKKEAAKRRVTDFADLLPSAAIDFMPNLQGQAS